MKEKTRILIQDELRLASVSGKFTIIQTSAKQQINLKRYDILVHLTYVQGSTVLAKFEPKGDYEPGKEFADSLAAYVRKKFKDKAYASKIVFNKPKTRIFALNTKIKKNSGSVPLIDPATGKPGYSRGEAELQMEMSEVEIKKTKKS